MKIFLFKKFRTILNSGFALLSTTTLSVGVMLVMSFANQASAAIYTWAGSNGNVHDGAANWDTESGGNGWAWNATSTPIHNTTTALLANILKFDEGDYTTTLSTQFNVMKLGGLFVTSTASDAYIFNPNNNTNREVVWSASGDADAGTIGGQSGMTNFIINQDFQFGSSNAQWQAWVYRSDANFQIAVGKIFTIHAVKMSYKGSESGANGYTLPSTPFVQKVSGGGTLKLELDNYQLSEGASWDLSGATTILDLSSIEAGQVASLGSLSMSDGATLNMGTNGATLNASLTMGSGGGTLLGTNVTLDGGMNYASGAAALTLDGTFTLADGFEFNFTGEYAENSEHILFRLNEGASLMFDPSQITVLGLSGRAVYSLGWNDANNEIVLTYTAGANPGYLHWNTGDGVWGHTGDAGVDGDEWQLDADSSLTDNHFFDGDHVTFSGETGGTVTLEGLLAPGSITIEDGAAWVLSGSGSIIGVDTSITMNGSGSIALNTANSYGGGTTINSGILSLGSAGAIASGDLTVNGGSIQITVDATFSNAILGSATTLFLDITNGSTVTWNATSGKNITLTNSSYDPTLSPSQSTLITGSLANRTVHVGDGVILKTTADMGSGNVSISGTGTFWAQHTSGNLFIGGIDDFTGTLQTANGTNTLTLLQSYNSEDSRFFLSTSNVSTNLNKEAIVMGTASWSEGSTLYLRGLSGYSNISTAYGSPSGTNGTKRGIDLLMEEDNTYRGNFYSNSATDTRWGTVTIGGDGHTFHWSGTTAVSTYGGASTLGLHAKMLIKSGATVNFMTNEAGISGGQWLDDIEIESGGQLLISRTDATGFVQRAEGNEITGDGAVRVTGKATLNGENTHLGGTSVSGADAELTVASDGALSTGNVTVADGATLKFSGEREISNAITIAVSGKFEGEASDTAITLNGNISSGFDVTRTEGVRADLALSVGAYTVNDSTVSGLNIDALSDATLNLNGVRLENGVTFTDGGKAQTTMHNVEIAPTEMATRVDTLTTHELSDGSAILNTDVTIYTLKGVALSDTITGTLTFDLTEVATAEELAAIQAAYNSGLAGIELHDITGLPEDFWYNNVQFKLSDTVTIKALGVTTVTGSASGNLVFVVPEPSTTALSLIALAGLLARRRRKTEI